MYKYYKENGDLTEWLDCTKPYLCGDQIKLFLEDIYICDSKDIIELQDNHLYTWENIKHAVKRYEESELKSV